MRKLVGITVLAAALATAPLFASEPFPIPQNKMPPAHTPVTDVPPYVAPRPVPNAAGPMTIEQFKQSGIRGVRYHYFNQALSASSTTIDTLTSNDMSTPEEGTSDLRSAKVGTLATVGTTRNTSNDANQDAEPTVTAVKIETVNYTVAANIKYVTNTTPRNHVSFSQNGGTFSAPVQLPLPTGYTLSADPVLAVNPQSGGIAPKRVYCVGVLANPGLTQGDAIGVWRSDNGGQTWVGPSIVAAVPTGSGHYLDKPWIVVSWHGGTLGNVYVTFVNLNETNIPASYTNTSLWVYRSTDGGLTFPTNSLIAVDDVQGPQVVVNPLNGTVHSLWLNAGNNDLRSAASTNAGVTFGSHEIAAVGGNLLTRNTGIQLTGGVRAWSFPIARYNWVSNRLAMVYHARGAGGSTEVYYTYRPCSLQCNVSGWEVPRQLNDVTTNDQFFPGIDFNAAGNMVVAFYDRRNDTTNIRYEDYFAYISPSGAPLHGNVRISTFATDPRQYTAATGAASFVGDYREVWDWPYADGETAVAAWIGIPPLTVVGDAYATRIFY
jgi:hypothetical protein